MYLTCLDIRSYCPPLLAKPPPLLGLYHTASGTRFRYAIAHPPPAHRRMHSCTGRSANCALLHLPLATSLTILKCLVYTALSAKHHQLDQLVNMHLLPAPLLSCPPLHFTAPPHSQFTFSHISIPTSQSRLCTPFSPIVLACRGRIRVQPRLF